MATPATVSVLTVTLAVALCAYLRVTASPTFQYHAIYDFENNRITSHRYVTRVRSLSGSGCRTRGTLKIALASAAEDPQRRRVLVDMFFRNPKFFAFNLGDSISNNGFGGDSYGQSHDAEIHAYNQSLMAFMSDHGGRTRNLFIENLFSTRLTLLVGDGHILWMANNNNVYNYFYNDTLFALNGQPDSEGPVNYNLYLGMNKVVHPSSRYIGSGLCKVGIRFLPEY